MRIAEPPHVTTPPPWQKATSDQQNHITREHNAAPAKAETATSKARALSGLGGIGWKLVL